MKFRTTAILAFVLLGAVIFVYFATRNGPDDSSSTPDVGKSAATDSKDRKLFDIAADKLDHLTIHPASGPDVEMAKSGFEWKIVKPIDWPADSSVATKIVSAIVDLRSRGGIELNSANLASAGLDHPQFVITASGDGKSLRLEVGNHAALGNDMYVKAGESKQADLVPAGTLGSQLADGMDKLIDALRDKKLISTPQASIQQVEIVHNAAKLALEKTADKTGEKWKVIEPAQIGAETSEVISLLDDVTRLSASQFSTESAAQEAGAKLNEPRLTIRFSTFAALPAHPPTATAVAAPPGTIIAIGQPVDIEAQNAWVKITAPDRPTVVAQATLSKSAFDKLKSVSLLTLRDRDVVNIDPDAVSKFTVAINRPATTQPTTKPAEARDFTIERHKIAPPVLGPALPPGVVAPTTRPSVATTQPSAPTTQPSSPTTQPAVATTQPVDDIADAKWIFASGGTGRAEEGQVEALLGGFRPLRVDKFIEPTKDTGTTYTLTIHAVPAKAADVAEDHVFTFIETPTRVIGTYKDLQFEVDRGLIDKLTGDFKTRKVPPPPPSAPPSFPGGGLPFGVGGQ